MFSPPEHWLLPTPQHGVTDLGNEQPRNDPTEFLIGQMCRGIYASQVVKSIVQPPACQSPAALMPQARRVSGAVDVGKGEMSASLFAGSGDKRRRAVHTPTP